MRSITANLIAEKNKLSTPSAWLPLLDVSLTDSTTLSIVPNPAAVTFDGTTYTPFPLQLDSVSADTKGGLNDVLVSVSNIDRSVQGYIETNELRGRSVRIRWVNSAYLSDPTYVAIDETFEIVGILVKGAKAVQFVLGHQRILQQQFPGGRFYRNSCRWIYKSTECGYVGAIATCDKVLEGSNGCRAHSNVARFGGFPGIISVIGRGQ